MSGSEDLLKSLPSWTHYYEKFEKSPPGCTDTNKCNTERDSYGLLNRGLGNEHVQAGNTLAYIYETYGGGQHRKPAECEALHFFFYWLGDKLPESAKNVAFQAMISTICSAINSPSEKQACGIPRDDQSVDKDLFLHRKIIFDFWYDHPTIQVLLENSGSEGLEKCEKYIQRVKAAHSAVAINCATETTRSYCTTFWKDHQEKINLALAQLQSKFDSAQQRIQRKAITASNQLNDAIHQANKASSLSSAFGTLAALELPALAYFLYKYKPWSSWFGNNSSGGGRKSRRRRRRRSTRNEFDTLTEGASTVDFTGSSEGSSILDSPTVHSSAAAAYTRQLNRGREGKGGANNSTPAHRNNVGYSRM